MADKTKMKGNFVPEKGISRRDFIKKALITTAYVVPVITTFRARELMADPTSFPKPVPPPKPVSKSESQEKTP